MFLNKAAAASDTDTVDEPAEGVRGQLLTLDVRADLDTGEAKLGGASLQLGDRGLGVLHRHRA